MSTYETLAKTVHIDGKNRLISYGDALEHIGTGRSAFVFRIQSSGKAIKIFFPAYSHIAKEEAAIYKILQDIPYYPAIYESGLNYIVMDYIEGLTLFERLSKGKIITKAHIKEIDHALSLAAERGLNPSDIHLRNIFLTDTDEIMIIDVARFRQMKDCRQWMNLKKAYDQLYTKCFFPKKVSSHFLNILAFLYKKGWIPSYRA
ncbi:serine/threonine protein kinase [Sporosarcina sp. HYO08]|uniref:serine/threonine protein kinase n=1 Tax=Sporosarcina sp. HYO08 TaxID=1759557 RepID=UPI00079293BB|nr:serine/threonine protein kinase [Sporosarcina sp. HYO08]KXH87205.1 serine/threonine protein kinase [Sporosarcina sp. HYO08]